MSPARDLVGQIRVGGRMRHFLTVPAAGDDPRAIVAMLHGTKQDGLKVRELSGRDLDRLPAVLAYPDGLGGGWDQGGADVAFVWAMLDGLRERWGELPVIAAGFGSGGALALRLLDEIPEAIGGVVAVAAPLPLDHGTEAAAADPAAASAGPPPLPVTLVHGTRDRVVPFEGGSTRFSGGEHLSARASARALAQRGGLADEPARTEMPGGVTRLRWEDPRAPVTLYAIEGGGHTIPNPVKRFPVWFGRTCRELSIADVVRELPVGEALSGEQ